MDFNDQYFHLIVTEESLDLATDRQIVSNNNNIQLNVLVAEKVDVKFWINDETAELTTLFRS